MSAAAIETAAPEAFDGFVGSDRSVARENPHALRYAYMPGVFYAQSEARVTGYTFFPQGQLITFRTFPVGGHFNSASIEDKKAPSSRIVEITAEDALANAGIEYPIFESVDQGFVGLPALTGDKNAQDYFNLLHPPFAAVGHECPFGLTVCPTCRAEWLESEGAKNYFNTHKNFDTDSNVALAVKQSLYDSVTRFKAYCDQSWQELADQFERTRNAGTPFVMAKSHHHTRKCIHELTMEDRELNRLREMTSSNAAAIGDAVRGIGTPAANDFTDEELAEIYAKRAAKAKQNGGVQIKTSPDAPPLTITSGGSGTDTLEIFGVGASVLCEGAPGVIQEAKSGGWFDVKLDSGEISTVRKDKLSIKEKADEHI